MRHPLPVFPIITADTLQFNWDHNGLDHDIRTLMVYARGLKDELISWFFANYELRNADSGTPIDGFRLVYQKNLAWQLYCIHEGLNKLPNEEFEGTDLASQEEQTKMRDYLLQIEEEHKLTNMLGKFRVAHHPPRLRIPHEVLGVEFKLVKKDMVENFGTYQTILVYMSSN